jgi:hypothetical protein
MGTPSLRVYWPDARARACWADPPNWRRPGLTLYGDGGTPELLRCPSRRLSMAIRTSVRPTSTEWSRPTPCSLRPNELWEVVRRWRAYAHDRFEDSDAPWVLGELLDVQGKLEAPMTVPPRRARAGALLDGARLATVPELTVEETTASGKPRPGGWRGWLLPDAKSWTVSGGTGRGLIRAERGDARSRRPWAGPWSGRAEVEWPAEPSLTEQILALHVADA